MTLKEMRELVKERNEAYTKMGLEELVPYNDSMMNQIEELYRNGNLINFTNDFLSYANGYQITRSEYKDLHICQTYGLRRIIATKKVTKELADMIFNTK